MEDLKLHSTFGRTTVHGTVRRDFIEGAVLAAASMAMGIEAVFVARAVRPAAVQEA